MKRLAKILLPPKVNGIGQTLDDYRKLVMERIIKRLNGKPKFALDEFELEMCWYKSYDPDVMAESAIKDAIKSEKEKAKR